MSYETTSAVNSNTEMGFYPAPVDPTSQVLQQPPEPSKLDETTVRKFVNLDDITNPHPLTDSQPQPRRASTQAYSSTSRRRSLGELSEASEKKQEPKQVMNSGNLSVTSSSGSGNFFAQNAQAAAGGQQGEAGTRMSGTGFAAAQQVRSGDSLGAQRRVLVLAR